MGWAKVAETWTHIYLYYYFVDNALAPDGGSAKIPFISKLVMHNIRMLGDLSSVRNGKC